MAYRPEWFEEISQGRCVLSIAGDIHSTLNGSYERRLEHLRDDVKAIRHVLENWQEPTSAFDNAVHYLLTAAIAEFDEYYMLSWDVINEAGCCLIEDETHQECVGFRSSHMQPSTLHIVEHRYRS